MLSVRAKKTASAPSARTLAVTPGPLPGTEPGAGGLQLRLKPKGIGGWWRLIQAALFVAVVAAALAGFLDAKVHVGDGHFTVRVADSAEERIVGLSGTNNLASDHGMLFIFDQEGFWPMWMKDMHYPIDIVWLNKDKKVVTIQRNLSPDTYPQAFMSEGPALYALELPAGTADAYHIVTGQTARIDL